jgi:hypothetical protein
MGVAACGSRTGLFGGAERSDASSGGGVPDVAISGSDATLVGADGSTQDGPAEFDVAVPTDAACASYGDAALPDATAPGGLCPDGTVAKGPPYDFTRACASCAAPALLEFDSSGVLVSVQSENPSVVDCLKAFLGKSCYPSLACTVLTLTGHCWVA